MVPSEGNGRELSALAGTNTQIVKAVIVLANRGQTSAEELEVLKKMVDALDKQANRLEALLDRLVQL